MRCSVISPFYRWGNRGSKTLGSLTGNLYPYPTKHMKVKLFVGFKLQTWSFKFYLSPRQNISFYTWGDTEGKGFTQGPTIGRLVESESQDFDFLICVPVALITVFWCKSTDSQTKPWYILTSHSNQHNCYTFSALNFPTNPGNNLHVGLHVCKNTVT